MCVRRVLPTLAGGGGGLVYLQGCAFLAYNFTQAVFTDECLLQRLIWGGFCWHIKSATYTRLWTSIWKVTARPKWACKEVKNQERQTRPLPTFSLIIKRFLNLTASAFFPTSLSASVVDSSSSNSVSKALSCATTCQDCPSIE